MVLENKESYLKKILKDVFYKGINFPKNQKGGSLDSIKKIKSFEKESPLGD